MSIRVVCPSCRRQLNAPDKLAGRKAKCPSCSTALTIQAAVPQKVSPPAPKERKLPKRREPEPEERITHLEEVPDEDEQEEEVVAAKAAKTAKRPKRKKRKSPSERSEPQASNWLLWLISVGGFVFVAGSIAGGAIYKGHGAEVLLYSVIMAVMIPISTVILVISMFISSWLTGGIDFGEARVVIPRAACLLLIVNLISLVPFGGFVAAPVWLFGLMFLFQLELLEARVLVLVNWGLNFLARMAVFAVLVAAFTHGGSHLSPINLRSQPAASTAEEQAMDAIIDLGGDCSSENDEDDGPIVAVTLARTRATDADLARLKGFAKLRKLDLSATQITDAGLVHLKELKQLETLTLTGTKVTDAGVAGLQAALPRVRIVR